MLTYCCSDLVCEAMHDNNGLSVPAGEALTEKDITGLLQACAPHLQAQLYSAVEVAAQHPGMMGAYCLPCRARHSMIIPGNSALATSITVLCSAGVTPACEGAMLPGSGILDTGLLDTPPVRDVLACSSAAPRVVHLSLQCLETITAWDGLSAASQRPLLTAVLAAMASPPADSQPPSSMPSQPRQVRGGSYLGVLPAACRCRPCACP